MALNIEDYSWNAHEQSLKQGDHILRPSKPKIRIDDSRRLRLELENSLELLTHHELAAWALANALPFLKYLDPHLQRDSRIERALAVFDRRLKQKASAYELRQAGFIANQLAKESTSELSKAAARVFAQAIATGHMRGHGLVSSDYAVKVVNLLAPTNLEKVSHLRQEQLNTIQYVRPYHGSDKSDVMKLITKTIQTVNSQDYREEQIAVWSRLDPETWEQSLVNKTALVMRVANKIVGFGDISPSGYLDRLFVHHEHQHQGIATKLVSYLEKASGAEHFSTYASITAVPFFESQGYSVTRKNLAILRETEFINYEMEK